MSKLVRINAWTLVALLCVYTALARSDPSLVVQPLPLPGPYTVGCSNVTQDFSRVPSGENAESYWEGIPRDDGSSRYVTDLLSDPADTPAVQVNAPNDSSVYGSFAGQTVSYVVLVCYPTSADNPRPDYALPTGQSVPHMQSGADAPLWPDSTTRFPLLLFSHGYLGSPLSADYVTSIPLLASYGYVVAAPFHGDGRFFTLSLESVSDIVFLFTHLQDFLALQALRPLSLSATTDLLLTNPQWSNRIDATQIGAFGASLGGESALLMRGAGLTTSLGLSWSTVINDARLKAAVGYVPYFGQPIFPAFGRDQHGLDNVALPFLAISGTADTTAPIVETLQGMGHLAGPHELVALNGVTHTFDVASTNDIFTWTLTFLAAEVRGDPVARATLLQMASVAGGGDDVVLVPYTAPAMTNYEGLWWASPAGSEAGWGINFAHQGDTIVATWFTYDVTGKGLWLVMTARQTDANIYSGTLYTTTGPPFNAVPFSPGQVMATAVGTGTLSFSDSSNGTFAYTVNGISQSKAITRQVFEPLPSCATAIGSLAAATNYQDLWWAAPAGSESGWGINLTHQGDIIFATWFTYDGDGTPLWLAVTAPKTAPGMYSGTLYRVTGPPFNAVPFNPGMVVPTAVGNATFSFSDGNNASFAYTVNGVSQAKAITREVFEGPGTICQ
jgi:predicted dienelactone hydrolase